MRKTEYSVALYIDMKHHLVLGKGVITFAHMPSAYWLILFLVNKQERWNLLHCDCYLMFDSLYFSTW